MNNDTTRLERILGISSTISSWFSLLAIMAMTLMIVVAVVFRYILKLSIAFDTEYTGYLLLIISFVGAAYALKVGSHVSVDFVTRLLPPRVQRWLQVVTDGVSLVCIILLVYYMYQLTFTNLGRGTVSVTPMETPLGPVQLFMVLGGTLFILQLLAMFSESLRAAVARETTAPEKKLSE